MKIQKQKNISKNKILMAITLPVMLGALPLFSVLSASAAPITGRSIELSTSAGDASGVTYSLTTDALASSSTPVKSLGIQFCTTATGGCSSPAGLSTASSTLASQPTGLGAGSGWQVSVADTGSLRIYNASNSTNPSGSVSVIWNSVHNPTATNTPFYGIVTTYSDESWTTAIDTGTVALSTSSQIQVGLTVGETLTFCTGTSITGNNCATASGTYVNLGEGSTTATATGTSVLAASTNGSAGYSVSVTGDTLSSGGATITAMSSGGASSAGTKQFGFNLADGNTAPAVGAARTGTGTATATANYGTNNNFRFVSGESIVSSAGSTNSNTFTVGYIANIDGTTSAGIYSTVLTYTATANF